MSGFLVYWKKKEKGREPLHKCSSDVAFANVISHPLGPRMLRPDVVSRTDSASVTDVLWTDRWESTVSSFVFLAHENWVLCPEACEIWSPQILKVFTESSGFCSCFHDTNSNAYEDSHSYTSWCYLIQVDETLK